MTKNTVFRGLWFLGGVALAVSVGACGAKSVDLGANEDTLVEETTLAGTWIGSVSSSAFLTGTKTLRLDIDAAGQGTLLVGEATLPPLDPSVGSPPEAAADAAQSSEMLFHLYEGATYPLQNVQVNGNAFHFAVDTVQAFQPWCAIQTPILTNIGHRCRENWGGMVDRSNGEKRCFVDNPITQAKEEEDCLALWLCSVALDPVCRCTETACAAGNSREPLTAPFDLELRNEGSLLSGALTWERSASAVVLHRQPQE
jgi:hypothetical protein